MAQVRTLLFLMYLAYVKASSVLPDVCLICWQGPVFLYYSLTNYYQNHRRYVKSRDDEQLRGEPRSYWSLRGSDCPPFVGNSSTSKAYAPCGAIANSMFNGI